MDDRRHERQIRLLMGLGLDEDGHKRITSGDDFLLLGGSESTHERMQEDVERFRHSLEKRGTDLQHATREEMMEAAHESGLVDEKGRPKKRPRD